ncbi:MAG: MFS transporter [Methanobacteriota archaeon]
MQSAGKNKERKPIYLDTNIQIIFGVTLTSLLGLSVITPVFPMIVNEFNITPQEIGLLVSIFTLPGIILSPIFGIFADRLGRKNIMVPSLMLFGVAGGTSFFASDFNTLLILRFFQGIGMAPLWPLIFTIVSDLFSGKRRAAAIGYNVSITNVGHAIFPAIGGALAILGWQYPFLLSLVAIPVGLIVLFSLKNPEPRNKHNLKKYLSNFSRNLKNRQVVGLIVIGAVIFIVFGGAYLVYFPLLIGNSFGASPLIIGLVMTIMPAAAAITASQTGKLAKMYPEKNLLKATFVLYIVALVIIPFVNTLWLLFIPSVLFGIAFGLSDASRMTLLSKLAPMIRRAALLSADEMILVSGLTSGPLLMGVIFSFGGINGVFYAAAGLSILMLAFSVIMLR